MDYRALYCSSNWLQVIFTTRASGAYLEEHIRTWRKTLVQDHVPGTFHGRIAVAALQRAFLRHYLSAPDLPIVTTDM